MWGLLVWMWERMPVGRPIKLARDPWIGIDEGNPNRFSTVAYSWDKVDGYTGNSKVYHKGYINELDTLTQYQVIFISHLS